MSTLKEDFENLQISLEKTQGKFEETYKYLKEIRRDLEIISENNKKIKQAILEAKNKDKSSSSAETEN